MERMIKLLGFVVSSNWVLNISKWKKWSHQNDYTIEEALTIFDDASVYNTEIIIQDGDIYYGYTA